MSKRLSNREIERAMDWRDDPKGDILRQQKEHRLHDQKENISKPRERDRRLGPRPLPE